MANHREDAGVVLTVDVAGFDKIAGRLITSLTTIDKINKVLKAHGRILQRRAVANVSGITRTFGGSTWIINRVTGKLSRSIQVTYPNPLVVMCEATAEYASDVELGTRGPTDLKKTNLAGKIVPMPMSKKGAMAGQSALAALSKSKRTDAKYNRRLDSKGNPITQVGNILMRNKYATTGKVMGTTSIRFLRVPGPG